VKGGEDKTRYKRREEKKRKTKEWRDRNQVEGRSKQA